MTETRENLDRLSQMVRYKGEGHLSDDASIKRAILVIAEERQNTASLRNALSSLIRHVQAKGLHRTDPTLRDAVRQSKATIAYTEGE